MTANLRVCTARGTLAALALAVVFGACGLRDADPPTGVEPITLPGDGAPVVREDFSGPGPSWEIVDGTWSRRAVEDGNGVLAQTATDRDFPVALLPGPVLADLEVEVRFRPISGRVDASGGIVFRARDPRNYYLVRANALEDNFRLYRIEDGRRRQIASTRIDAPSLGAWHGLRVVAVGERIQAFLDGELLIDHRDAGLPAGRVGLWTKADAVTEFDDLVVRGTPAAVGAAGTASLDAAAIGRAAGTEAQTTADGVVRIGWSRSDVKVRVDGARLDPAAGLGSWAAFKPAGEGALVMGDTVVFEDEISPALNAALAAGLEVTALHNHFVFDDPPVYFMHLGGHGDAESLAAGVKRVWDAIRAVRAEHPHPRRRFPGAPPAPGDLDAEGLSAVLGHAATRQGDVVKVTIAREGRAHGVAVGGSLGLTTWAAFSGSDARASVDGDFIMTAAEVQSVLRALRAAGIHVVALHNHMLEDEPRFFFVHYWGKGAAIDLAQGVKAALEAQRASDVSRGAAEGTE